MFKKITKSKGVSIVSLISFAFVTAGSLWAYFALRGVANGPLILHFDDLSGITAVGSSASITFMGLFGMVVVLMNFAIALELDARDRFLGKLTAAITLIFSILLFVAFIAIINVN